MEPGRKVPYSVDLCHRMIRQVIYMGMGMGMTLQEIWMCHLVKYIFYLKKLARLIQNLQTEPPLQSCLQLIVIGLILDNPGLYLGQNIADVTGTGISSPTLCRIPCKHGLTSTKINWYAIFPHKPICVVGWNWMWLTRSYSETWVPEYVFFYTGVIIESAITAMCTDRILATEVFFGFWWL